MSDFLYTLLWFSVYAIPSFVLQLILCFKAKNKCIKYIPVYIVCAGIVFTMDTYFNFTGLHSGWNELAAFITGLYTAIFASGVICAFIVHKIYIKRKKR